MTRASLAARGGRALEQRLGLVDVALHGVGERQVAQDGGLIGRQLQGPLVERDGLAVLALLGEHGAARRDHASSPGWSGRRPAPAASAARLTWSNSSASRPYSPLMAAMGGVEHGGLLQHGERLLLLALRLEVAGVVEGGLRVPRVLGVLLAPVLGGLLQLARCVSAARVRRWSAARARLGCASQLPDSGLSCEQAPASSRPPTMTSVRGGCVRCAAALRRELPMQPCSTPRPKRAR